MKLLNNNTLLGTAVLVLALCSFAAAQSPQTISNGERPQPPAPRPELLRELALTPDQVQAVKRISMERRPAIQEARNRFFDAERALNIAIYPDNVDDAEVRARLSEFQQAQAELARVKFTSELAIRKLLTPSQLMKFRDLRQRFAGPRDAAGDDGRGRRGRLNMRRIRPGSRPYN